MFDSHWECIWVTWELDRYTILRPPLHVYTRDLGGASGGLQVILMLAVIWKPLTDPIHLTITSYSGNSVYWPKKKKGNKTLLFWSYFPFNQPYDITPCLNFLKKLPLLSLDFNTVSLIKHLCLNFYCPPALQFSEIASWTIYLVIKLKDLSASDSYDTTGRHCWPSWLSDTEDYEFSSYLSENSFSVFSSSSLSLSQRCTFVPPESIIGPGLEIINEGFVE